MSIKKCVVDRVRTNKGAIVWVAIDDNNNNKSGVGITINSAIANLFADTDEETFEVQITITEAGKRSIFLEA